LTHLLITYGTSLYSREEATGTWYNLYDCSLLYQCAKEEIEARCATAFSISAMMSSLGMKRQRSPDEIEMEESLAAHAMEMKEPRRVPSNLATISSGFEKGDFLVREEQGCRVYFDFFEEAFNYIANKGYTRMIKEEETEWLELMNTIHGSVKGGMRYNTGKLLMVLSKPVPEDKLSAVQKQEKSASKEKVPLSSSAAKVKVKDSGYPPDPNIR
jgi:hypothetical protein